MSVSSVDVRLLFFAKTRDLAGISETTTTLPVQAKVSTLLDIICKNYKLEIVKNNIILAINEEYCDNLEAEVSLNSGDEVALIPPISGG